MSLKTVFIAVLKLIALTIFMFVCFAVAGSALGVGDAPAQAQAQTQTEPAGGALSLLFACLLNTLVLSYLIVRSRWYGWRLMATIFIVFYGVMTVMSQIESAVFITKLPSGMLPKLFAMGALLAAPFAIIAVLILGKRKAAPNEAHNERLRMPANEWAWKLGALVLAYVVLYFTFGYFIAWREPAVREYYGGGELRGFFAHMSEVLRNQTWLVFLQMLRGAMWIALALPIIRMMKGARWETALGVALLFSVVMNSQLLLPNAYMPETVRMTHLLETATSNFIFGGLVAWLLSHKSPHTERMKNAIRLHA